MKPNHLYSVVHGLNCIKNNMKKLLLVMLFALTFVGVKAQGGKTFKSELQPLVSITNNIAGAKGELILIGYNVPNGAKYPLTFEWKSAESDKIILANGSVDNEIQLNNLKEIKGSSIYNLKAGKYILVTHDSSLPKNQTEHHFTVK